VTARSGSRSLRLGILGGTFNPPHNGHLTCARAALEELRLDRVVLVPVGIAPHKEIEHDAGAQARYEMCERAASGDPGLAVSRMEIDREGPSYTVDTLRSIREDSPGQELYFIMGGDQATELGGWKDPEEVLRLATVAVAEREGARRAEIAAALSELAGGDRVVFFAMPRVDVSSTMVRERVANGEPIRDLVPEAVADYIERAGLYRQGVAA
jgi:nicotinate-nucleotide adenylyltransferase